ncbi:hypothetical protein MRX96_008098 [Rhipicephalus microplus]
MIDAFFLGIRLPLATSKTEILLVHPRVSIRFSTPRHSLWGLPIKWNKTIGYHGVTSDNRLSWRPAVDDLRYRHIVKKNDLDSTTITTIYLSLLHL